MFYYLVVRYDKSDASGFSHHFFVDAQQVLDYIAKYKSTVWKVYKLTDLTDLYTGTYIK